MSVRLGEILVKESLISQDQLQKALEYQRANGGKLGSCLTKMGFITDDDITGVLSRTIWRAVDQFKILRH